MALKFLNLTSQISGSNQIFTVAPASYVLGSTILILNGAVQNRGVDYNENSNGITISTTFVPASDDVLGIYFDVVPAVLPIPSGFTTAMLRSDYLFGLDLKDQIGRTLPDQVLANKLSIALARMQRELKDFSIVPQTIGSPAPCDSPPGTYDVVEDPYDYDVNDYINWGFLVLRRKPVISVQRIRLIYPTGQTIIQYPLDWIKIYHKPGQIQIVPMAGSFNQYPLIGQGAMYLPLMSGFLTKSVPQLIYVDYTAGLSTVPYDLTDAIYKLAAIDILKDAGQGKAPGVASLSTSADGLSENTTLTQSANTTLFSAQIKLYQEEVKQFIIDFLENQKGIDFRVA